jgi:hypothetical protein
VNWTPLPRKRSIHLRARGNPRGRFGVVDEWH